MPRTLPTELEAAMDSGVYEPYLKVVIGSDRTIEATVEPIAFKIEALKATIQIEGAILATIDPGNFRIIRGVTINGANYTISTIWFKVIELSYDGKFANLVGEPLPKNSKTITANSSYETVIETTLLEPSLDLEIIPNYEGSAIWKNYQFFPTGRTIVLGNRKDLFTLLRQKYLIFATEDGWDGTQDNIFFFVATETRSTDYTITDQLFTFNTKTINKKLVSRDQFGSIRISGDTGSPLHNLGFIKSGEAQPTYAPLYQASSKSSKIPVHLKYRTGDLVDIVLDDVINPLPMRIKVTEVLDTKATPAWHMIIETLEWFGSTEGGAIPSTLEASAPYTPLVTTNFNKNLDSTVNNLQALADKVDDLDLGGTAPTTTAANDFQVGDGAGAWIKKTLAQTIAILGIFADAASDSVYYVRRNATWTNLKTYTDTLYQTIGSYITDAASDSVYYVRRNATWTNAKTYFDTLYAALSHTHAAGDVEFLFPFATYVNLNPINSSGLYPYAGTVEASMTLLKWSQELYLLGSHDTSNYYQLDMVLRQAGVSDVVVASFDTKTAVGGTNSFQVTSFISPSITGTGYLYIVCYKGGSAADMYMMCPALRCGLT